MEMLKRVSKQFASLLYIVRPSEHVFQTVEEVPDYMKEITPVLIVVILLEQCIRYHQGKQLMRLNDTVANASQGMLIQLLRIPARGLEVVVYSYLYNNYRLAALPWDSVWTWLLCMVCTDFCFYWMHRISHQVSILWSIHEPHHSSEDMNFTIPFRNQVLLISTYWLTYLPMAVAIPPPIFFVHYQLNLVYQYWLHTEIVGKLGIVELIFNTPSHHRVHHGRSRSCIDKNFAGFLIIWDRMFGTFEEEGKEEITYGVTHPINSFNPLVIQTNHFSNVWNKFWSVPGFTNKLSSLFKGPGWRPGSPWLGYLHEVPEPEPGTPKYHPAISTWRTYYVGVHFGLVAFGYLQIASYHMILSRFLLVTSSAFIVISLVAFGLLLDNSSTCDAAEFARCVLYFVLHRAISTEAYQLGTAPQYTLQLGEVVYVCSLLLWTALCLANKSLSVLKNVQLQ